VMVRGMNSSLAILGERSQVAVKSIVERKNGHYAQHAIIEVEPATIEVRASADIVVVASNGRPAPPAPTIAQEACRAATLDPYLDDALRYFSRDADFIDLYRAFECLHAG